MNIILVSNHMSKARTLTFWQIALPVAFLMLLSSMLTAAFILPQAEGAHQGSRPSLPLQLISMVRDQPQVHINALALQLGEIQARLMRLDALSERLAQLAGIKDKDGPSIQPPGRGGPMVLEHDISADEMGSQLTRLAQELELRSERLGMVEALLLQQNLSRSAIPSGKPVEVGYNSSSFGWRVDPFTGQMALHEGLDFTAEPGTPIHAAARGIVAQAERTPDYGNIVKIDHGAGLETRYAHASRLLVRPGDRVEKGQLIAEVGNTGRSTGAHLHFEVRLNGVALDPRKYLQQSKS